MTVIDPSPFGALLRDHRVEAGLTQEELAERARLSARVVSDLERGVSRSPRLHTVRQLADALSLSTDEREKFTTLARNPLATAPASSENAPRDDGPLTRTEGSTDLRTFLIADIRGYSRFTQEQGDDAADALASKFARLTRECVTARGGILLELRGDEALCVFSSAREAIRAAVELQARFSADAEREPELPLAVGIGLDAGEAVRVEGGYRGDALNLVSRLQSLSAAGEVLVSEALTHLARKVEGFDFVERGLIEVKGFSQPVRVMEVVPEGSAAEDSNSEGSSEKSEKRLPIGGFLGALPAAPIVARDDELDRIWSCVQGVQSGVGRFLLLNGEEGAGKTRIAQEVTLELRDRGFRVSAGRCYESRSQTPFYPFLEALPSLYRAASISVQSRVILHWPQLSWLVPDELPPTTRPGGHPADDHHRLFGAAAGFLGALSEESPVAILLDDLQWADAESLELLHHLARELSVQKVFLLATYRDGNIERDTPLDRALRNLGREHLAERIPVRRLSREGTGSMVSATIGETEASDDFIEFVHRRTKGNPFFITRVLQTLGGRYRLVREVGAGGMGRVFEAIDGETGERVAAKLMVARTEADSHALQRFEQEGQVLARLTHPNIVKIHGTFLDERVSCIVMEMLDGQSLGQLLAGKSWSLSEVKALTLQVLSALECAHGQGIAHRDIKPDNIMISRDGAVKVTDFGIARMLRPIDTAASMTSTGMSMGTPLYVAPEQIRGQKVDGRADLYSLGAVLYQIVTRRPPFDGEDPLTLGIQHVQQDPTPPSEVNPSLPQDWQGLILRALAKDPAARYQTAKAMLVAVENLRTEESFQSYVDSSASNEAAGPEATISTTQASSARTRQSLAARQVDRLWGALGSKLLAAVPIAAILLATVLLVLTKPFGLSGVSQATPVQFGQLEGMALDPQGDVYAVDLLNSRVDKLSPSGALLGQLHIDRRGRFQALDYATIGPDGAVLDEHGNLFIADYGYHDIQKISANGTLVAPWPFELNQGRLTALGPTGLARDAKGYLYFADTYFNRIVRLSSTGTMTFVGNSGPQAHRLQQPTGVALDRNGYIYASDTSKDRIVKFSPGGVFLAQWGGTGSKPAQFQSPAGLTVDGHGNVYIADTDNHRIQEISPRGRFLRQWGGGNSRVQFNQPIDVKLDAAGNVYVADSADNVIDKLSPSGHLLAVWGKKSV